MLPMATPGNPWPDCVRGKEGNRMIRRSISLTLMALCLIVLAGAAQAIPYSVEVTGAFFSTMPTPLGLSAQLTPWANGKPVTFTGITPYTIKVKAGPVNTNALGQASVNANWAQNIYTVTAYAKLNGAGVTSPPVAVSRFNPRNFCGVQGGGALHLLSYDVPPNVQHTIDPRQATYALIYKLNPGRNFGILYYDNDDPLGAVSFVAKSYESVIVTPVPGDPAYNILEFRGVGRAVLGGVPMWVHYYVYLDDYPDDNYFYIELTSITGRLLYESAGPGDEDQMAEQHVYDGKNVIVLCGG